MVDHVVVEELDIPRLERHLVAPLVADRGQQVERLVLGGGEARDIGDLLRGLHEGARVLGGELTVPHREDGHRVDRGLPARLLALPGAVVVRAEQRVQIRPALEDGIAHRGDADHPARAAPAGRAHAEQPDHVAAVGVPAQGPARARLGTRGEPLAPGDRGLDHLAVEPDLVAHLADELAVSVLVHRLPEVAAEPPPDRTELVVRVALRRQAAQEHEAAPPLEIAIDLGQLRRDAGQREVLPGDVPPPEPACLRRAQGRVDLVDGARREPVDPVGRAGEVTAVPDHRPGDRRVHQGARHGPPRLAEAPSRPQARLA